MIRPNKILYVVIGAIILASVFPAWFWLLAMPQNAHDCPVAMMMGFNCSAISDVVMAWHHFSEWHLNTMVTLVTLVGLSFLSWLIFTSYDKRNKISLSNQKSVELTELAGHNKILSAVILNPYRHYFDLVRSAIPGLAGADVSSGFRV